VNWSDSITPNAIFANLRAPPPRLLRIRGTTVHAEPSPPARPTVLPHRSRPSRASTDPGRGGDDCATACYTSVVDRELSDDLTSLLPLVPHGTVNGVDCCGCIVAVVEGTNVELRCNECGAVVGVVQIDILRGLLGLRCATATCPHCGKLNTFPGFNQVSTYVCDDCGKPVEIEGGE